MSVSSHGSQPAASQSSYLLTNSASFPNPGFVVFQSESTYLQSCLGTSQAYYHMALADAHRACMERDTARAEAYRREPERTQPQTQKWGPICHHFCRAIVERDAVKAENEHLRATIKYMAKTGRK